MDWIAGGGRKKKNHVWEDNPKMFINLMSRLTETTSVIFDPFTGSGSVPVGCKMLHRNYLAFEIDPDTAEMARNRVAETQPPLPIVIHEQMELV